MNRRTVALLLAIPAIGMMAKSHARHHAWHDVGAAGHHGPWEVGTGRWPRGGRFAQAPGRLPPMIESKLQAWHERAHGEGTAGAADPVTDA